MKSLLAILVVLSGLVARAEAEVRTWKDRTGSYSIQAEFVGVEDGKVKLKRAGGELAVVPLDKLSDADR